MSYSLLPLLCRNYLPQPSLNLALFWYISTSYSLISLGLFVSSCFFLWVLWLSFLFLVIISVYFSCSYSRLAVSSYVDGPSVGTLQYSCSQYSILHFTDLMLSSISSFLLSGFVSPYLHTPLSSSLSISGYLYVSTACVFLIGRLFSTPISSFSATGSGSSFLLPSSHSFSPLSLLYLGSSVCTLSFLSD